MSWESMTESARRLLSAAFQPIATTADRTVICNSPVTIVDLDGTFCSGEHDQCTPPLPGDCGATGSCSGSLDVSDPAGNRYRLDLEDADCGGNFNPEAGTCQFTVDIAPDRGRCWVIDEAGERTPATVELTVVDEERITAEAVRTLVGEPDATDLAEATGAELERAQAWVASGEGLGVTLHLTAPILRLAIEAEASAAQPALDTDLTIVRAVYVGDTTDAVGDRWHTYLREDGRTWYTPAPTPSSGARAGGPPSTAPVLTHPRKTEYDFGWPDLGPEMPEPYVASSATTGSGVTLREPPPAGPPTTVATTFRLGGYTQSLDGRDFVVYRDGDQVWVTQTDRPGLPVGPHPPAAAGGTATPALAPPRFADTGRDTPRVDLAAPRVELTTPPPSEPPPYLTWTMKDVIISGFQFGADASAPESVQLEFKKVESTYEAAESKAAEPRAAEPRAARWWVPEPKQPAGQAGTTPPPGAAPTGTQDVSHGAPAAQPAGMRIADAEAPRPVDRVFLTYDYFDAPLRSVELPSLDAASKDACQLTFTFKPEALGAAKAVPPRALPVKLFLTNNFRCEMGGEPLYLQKLELPRIKTKVAREFAARFTFGNVANDAPRLEAVSAATDAVVARSAVLVFSASDSSADLASIVLEDVRIGPMSYNDANGAPVDRRLASTATVEVTGARVAVRFPDAITDAAASHWARIAQATAGRGQGVTSLPEAGDEIAVILEGGQLRVRNVGSAEERIVDLEPAAQVNDIACQLAALMATFSATVAPAAAGGGAIAGAAVAPTAPPAVRGARPLRAERTGDATGLIFQPLASNEEPSNAITFTGAMRVDGGWVQVEGARFTIVGGDGNLNGRVDLAAGGKPAIAYEVSPDPALHQPLLDAARHEGVLTAMKPIAAELGMSVDQLIALTLPISAWLMLDPNYTVDTYRQRVAQLLAALPEKQRQKSEPALNQGVYALFHQALVEKSHGPQSLARAGRSLLPDDELAARERALA